MHVVFPGRPIAEGFVARPASDKRTRIQDVAALTQLVEAEMLPRYDNKTEKMTGAAIASFLLGKGHKIALSAISRIKAAIDERLRGNRVDSSQRLEYYLIVMAEKNPGSIWRFEKNDAGIFKCACFVPNIGIRVGKMARKLHGFDGTHLKGGMNSYGVFLVATIKDYILFITPFGFWLVPVENKDNWIWFLQAVKEALGDDLEFTVLSDWDKGLRAAVEFVFPKPGHRFCLRHIKGDIGQAPTQKERAIISKIANSDCENDYKLFASELRVTKPSAADYLENIEKKHWVKYVYLDHFHLPTYGETTSNLAQMRINYSVIFNPIL